LNLNRQLAESERSAVDERIEVIHSDEGGKIGIV
jgi:hypothetical protein